jgi:hypothetical protein
MRAIRGAGVVLAALLGVPHLAAGLTATERCEAGKLKVAGKYGFCRLKAESKAAKTGGVPDYSKCDQKYAKKWQVIETKGGGMCPSRS